MHDFSFKYQLGNDLSVFVCTRCGHQLTSYTTERTVDYARLREHERQGRESSVMDSEIDSLSCPGKTLWVGKKVVVSRPWWDDAKKNVACEVTLVAGHRIVVLPEEKGAITRAVHRRDIKHNATLEDWFGIRKVDRTVS